MAIHIRGVPVDSALRARIADRLTTAPARATSPAGTTRGPASDGRDPQVVDPGPRSRPSRTCWSAASTDVNAIQASHSPSAGLVATTLP